MKDKFLYLEQFMTGIFVLVSEALKEVLNILNMKELFLQHIKYFLLLQNKLTMIFISYYLNVRRLSKK